MATGAARPLITVEQYVKRPDPPGYVEELHFGRLVRVEIPRRAQYNMQMRIRNLLVKALSGKRWFIEMQVPYGLAAGYDVRGADVGVVLQSQWDAAPDSGYMIGSLTW